MLKTSLPREQGRGSSTQKPQVLGCFWCACPLPRPGTPGSPSPENSQSSDGSGVTAWQIWEGSEGLTDRYFASTHYPRLRFQLGPNPWQFCGVSHAGAEPCASGGGFLESLSQLPSSIYFPASKMPICTTSPPPPPRKIKEEKETVQVWSPVLLARPCGLLPEREQKKSPLSSARGFEGETLGARV